MTALDEDALICDFAETYHIYDFRALPAVYAATLACGLRDNSRIKLKMADSRVSPEMLLNAASLDALNLLVWFQTKDAQKGRNRPQSILEAITAEAKDKEIETFDDAESFLNQRKAMLERMNNGNRTG